MPRGVARCLTRRRPPRRVARSACAGRGAGDRQATCTELAALAGTAVDTEPARIAAYRELCDRYGVQWVMVSAGAEGIEACDGTRLLRAAAPAVPVVNSIGSGDAASAGVAAALIGSAGGADHRRDAVPAAVSGGAVAVAPRRADLAAAVRCAVACGSANCLRNSGFGHPRGDPEAASAGHRNRETALNEADSRRRIRNPYDHRVEGRVGSGVVAAVRRSCRARAADSPRQRQLPDRNSRLGHS